MSEEREPRGVGAVETGIGLLHHVIAAGGALSAAELGARSGLSKGQVHAYILSLTATGLLARDEAAAGRYRIGETGLRLGLARLQRMDAHALAMEEVTATARDLGQGIALAVWGTSGPTVIGAHPGNERMRSSARPGSIYSITGTASGRVFAALLPEAMVRRIHEHQVATAGEGLYFGSCPPMAEIGAELDRIRAQGLATSYSWPQPGASAVAAPVRNFQGELEMVLSLFGPDPEMELDLSGPHVRAAVALADRISAKLGYCAQALRQKG